MHAKYLYFLKRLRKNTINMPKKPIDEIGLRNKLLEAASLGDLSALEVIIRIFKENGLDVNVADDQGNTALQQATVNNRLDAVKILLKAGVNIDQKGYDGNTALMLAAYLKKIEILKALLKAGAKINEENKYGYTALTACTVEHGDIVKLLLSAGADPKHPIRGDPKYGRDGLSWISSARERFYSDIVNIFKKKKPAKKINNHLNSYVYEKRFNLIKSMGHKLGIRAVYPIPYNHLTYNITSEGNFSFESNQLLKNALKKHLQTLDIEGPQKVKGQFQMILEASKREGDFLSATEPLERGAEHLLQPYRDSRTLTYIPFSWEGHSACIGIYKDYLILCNRGEGAKSERFGGGTMIYHLTKEQQSGITPDWIMHLNPKEKPNNKQKAEQVLVELGLDLENPIAVLPTKDQKQGNCSFANRKSAIEGFLYVLERKNEIKKVQSRKARGKLSEDELNNIDAKAQAYAQKYYKSFTYSMRKIEIDQRLKEMAALSKEQKEDLNLYLSIFKDYLVKEYRKLNRYAISKDKSISRYENKNKVIVLRIKRILQGIDKALDQEEKVKFLNDLKKAALDVEFPYPEERIAHQFTTHPVNLAKIGARKERQILFPLIKAVKEGKLKMVENQIKNLKRSGVDIDTKWDDFTPLMHAVLGGHTKIVKKLLKVGANLYEKNSEGDTALMMAIDKNDKNMIKVLTAEQEKLNPHKGSFQNNKARGSIERYNVILGQSKLNYDSAIQNLNTLYNEIKIVQQQYKKFKISSTDAEVKINKIVYEMQKLKEKVSKATLAYKKEIDSLSAEKSRALGSYVVDLHNHFKAHYSYFSYKTHQVSNAIYRSRQFIKNPEKQKSKDVIFRDYKSQKLENSHHAKAIPKNRKSHRSF